MSWGSRGRTATPRRESATRASAISLGSESRYARCRRAFSSSTSPCILVSRLTKVHGLVEEENARLHRTYLDSEPSEIAEARVADSRLGVAVLPRDPDVRPGSSPRAVS